MRAEQTLLIVRSSHVSLQEGAGQIMLKMSILRTDDPSSPAQVQKRLVHRLEKLGYEVTLTPSSPAA
jgi:hypothetical protein